MKNIQSHIKKKIGVLLEQGTGDDDDDMMKLKKAGHRHKGSQ
jgi:hypothetical protein